MPGVRVRLKKTLNRRVGDKAYYKWIFADVPREVLEDLAWDEEGEYVAEAKDGAMVIKKRKGKA